MTTMTKPFHTPGPWRLANMDTAIIKRKKNGRLVSIAKMPEQNYKDASEEQNANAQLIVKAPEQEELIQELLGACKVALELHEVLLDSKSSHRSQCEMEELQRVIKKAEEGGRP